MQYSETNFMGTYGGAHKLLIRPVAHKIEDDDRKAVVEAYWSYRFHARSEMMTARSW